MRQIHIISLGASIVANYSRKIKELPPVSQDKKYGPALVKPLFNFVRNNPYEASAELNALKEFLENGSVNEVHFIVTETNVSKTCARVLEKYLKSNGIRVSGTQPIPGYYSDLPRSDERAAQNFVEGLGKLRDSLIDYVRSKRKEKDVEVLINATGGFKPEVVVLSLVGSLMRCKVYYIHEFFKRTIFLPPIFLAVPGRREVEMLKKLYAHKNKLIRPPMLKDFQEEFKDVIFDAIHLGLINQKVDEKNTIYEISPTAYGKFLYETYERLWEE
jgi:putative CRISPR-associated protein (TIGR02619 family)